MGSLGVFIWLILAIIELRARVPGPRRAASSRVRIGWTGWIGRLTWVVDFRYFPTLEARRTAANCWCLSVGPFRIAWERTFDVLTERTMVNWSQAHLMLAEGVAKRRKARLALYAMKFGADEPVTGATE